MRAFIFPQCVISTTIRYSADVKSCTKCLGSPGIIHDLTCIIDVLAYFLTCYLWVFVQTGTGDLRSNGAGICLYCLLTGMPRTRGICSNKNTYEAKLYAVVNTIFHFHLFAINCERPLNVNTFRGKIKWVKNTIPHRFQYPRTNIDTILSLTILG